MRGKTKEADEDPDTEPSHTKTRYSEEFKRESYEYWKKNGRSAAKVAAELGNNLWLAERLGMGEPASASQFVRRRMLKKEGGRNADAVVRSQAMTSSFLSLGFGYMKVHDLKTDIRTHTFYRQDYPFVGMADHTKVTEGNDDTGLLSEVFTDWSVKSLNTSAAYPSKFLFASQVEERAYDLNTHQLYLTTTTTTGIPDDYGNVTSITVATSDGYSKTTTSQYRAADTVGWILGRLESASVASSATGQTTVTRTSTFTYDLTATGGGLLKSETVEPGDEPFKLTTTYSYDAWGNKTAVETRGKSLTISGENYSIGADVVRVATTQYDTQGRFPLWTRNALLHEEKYPSYDQVLGVVLSMEGVNGLVTSWQYDGFGRKIREDRADGTFSVTHYRWPQSGAPTDTVYFVETETAGGAPGVSFHDKYGRVIESIGVSGDNRMIRQKTLYDSMGRVWMATKPFYTGATEYWSSTVYDKLGRPIQIVTPDDENGGQTVNYSYVNFTTTATDPKSRVTETVRNSQGWVVSTIRNKFAGAGAADYSSVTHSYDPLGNVLSTNADGATTTFVYDKRGRKTQMAEPNMGTWQYRYSIFGELIWQKDANANVVQMGYDVLGRLVTQSQPATQYYPARTITTTYDPTTGAGKGKVAKVEDTLGYEETYGYDNYGRPIQVSRKIGGTTYAVETGYDNKGRANKIVYPATGLTTVPFTIRKVYNDFGYLKEIRGWLDSDSSKANNQLQGRVFWRTDSFDVSGRIDTDIFGNGLANDRVYSGATGRLAHSATDRAAVIGNSYAVQNLWYAYDEVGNVIERRDLAGGRDERFYTTGSTNRNDGYDGLDRLLVHRVVGGALVTVSYNQKGNITNKSDVGSYTYGGAKPHAVTNAAGKAYSYDSNGNMTQAGNSYTGQLISWTSFGQVCKISTASPNKAVTFSFDGAGQRIKQDRFDNSQAMGNPTGSTIYVGAIYEKVGAGTTWEHKHYIMAPTGRVAVYTDRTSLVRDTRYLHTDALGSVTVVSDERGRVVTRYTYDAWGKQSILYTNPAANVTNLTPTTRGFTDHEELADWGLIHMNGRIYNPVLGRFVSADPFVGDADDGQEYNRYSYIANNPLGGTDPSGHFSLKDAVKIVAVAVAAYFTAGAALYGYAAASGGTFVGGFAGALGSVGTAAGWGGGWAVAAGAGAGFGGGFAGSLLNGGNVGDAFRAGIVGAAVGAVSAGLAGRIGDFAEANGWFRGTAQNLTHGALQGGLTEATGGEFRHGFYAGFASSAAGGSLQSAMPDHVAGRTIAAAVIGGTASAIGGGKFANGAVSAAFTHLFNNEAHADPEDAAHEQAREARRYIRAYKLDHPGEPVPLGDILDTIMLSDAYQVKGAGYEKDWLYGNFAWRLRKADSHFRTEFSADRFILKGGEVAFGGEINYYMQGFAHAARGSGRLLTFGRAVDLTVAHNVWQAANGDPVLPNLRQIPPGIKWTMRGYDWYNSHMKK